MNRRRRPKTAIVYARDDGEYSYEEPVDFSLSMRHRAKSDPDMAANMRKMHKVSANILHLSIRCKFKFVIRDRIQISMMIKKATSFHLF